VRRGPVLLACEHEEAAELSGEGGDVGVGHPTAKGFQGGLEPGDRLLRVPLVEVDLGEAGGDTGSRACLPLGLEGRMRTLEQRPRLDRVGCQNSVRVARNQDLQAERRF